MKTSLNFHRLGEICDIIIGRTPRRNNPNYWGDGHIWVSIADMQEKQIERTKEQITDEAVIEAKCRRIFKGTLLLSFKLSIGKLAFAGQDLFTNEAIAALPIKDRNHLYSEYLYYVLKHIPLTGSNQAAKGKTLNKKSLQEIKIPVPDLLDDQIRIATLLSRIEELISKRKESIHLLDNLLKSTFLDMFGTNAEGFDDWPTREIKSLAAKKKRSMRTGPFGSNLLHKEFSTEGDVAVLGIDNAVNNRFEWNQKRFITKKKYETLKNYTIYPRDVIITIMGTTGRSAVVPDNIPLAINTKHLAAITLDESDANPYFLSFSIYSTPYLLRQLRSQNRGAIMRGLNLGIIKKLKIKLPPIELQNHFEYLLKKVESLKAKYETSLQELENLYGALSQRAFSGELDVSKVPIHHKIEVHDIVQVQDVDSPIILTDKSDRFKLDLDSLKDLISKNFTKPFTFAMLWEQLNEILLEQETEDDEEFLEQGKELQNYETVQKLVYTMLNDSKPFLKQIFSQDSERGEIALELAR
jgi:type I restriction enzyme S subunit